jgi:hypothetical protein
MITVQLTSEQIARILISLGKEKSAQEAQKNHTEAHEISTLLAKIKEQSYVSH